MRTWSTGRGPSRSTASTRAPVHTDAPAARASSSSAGSSAERSNPTGSPSPYGRRKAIPVGVSTRIAGMGRATRASVASSSPTRRSAATVAGDANTPQARQRYAGLRSNRVTSWPARASSDATIAPDGPPPTIATSGSVTGRRLQEPCWLPGPRPPRSADRTRLFGDRPAPARPGAAAPRPPRASRPVGRTAANRHACSGSG